MPPSEELDSGNFHRTDFRRQPNTDNEHLTNDADDFWRRVVIRYPPNQESTPESRQEGLKLLSAFFKDPKHSKFPPKEITLIDATDEDNFPPLDEFLMDEDIRACMEEDMDRKILNGSFYGQYKEFALKCWGHSFVSQWAVNTLGYPPPG